jgi:glycosyltransferase involved in cell wall biosynthesis
MPHYDVPLTYSGPLVVTIHDLIHFLFPEYSTKPFTRAYSRFMLNHVTKRAARILTVSENTKDDLIRLFPTAEPKITVLYPAVDKRFKPVSAEDAYPVMKSHRLSPGYLLYIGNLREGKNIRRLIDAYFHLRQIRRGCPPLVLVGQSSLRGMDFTGMEPHIRHLGPVPFDQLPALYSSAALFVFPTLYEGFGLPPLEAMACGAPVLTSNVASLPEVCGDAADYTNPRSEEAIARALAGLLDHPDIRKVMRAKGLERVKLFSWRRFAEGTWNVYEQVAEEARR